MPKLSEVHAALVAQIGTRESPAFSNCQPYSHELGRPCESWCADFQACMLARRIGMTLPSTSAAVAEVMKAFKAAGRLVAAPAGGYYAFYHFRGEHAGANHIGWVEPNSITGGSFSAIEGNTSFGSDTNGGAVMRRIRSQALVIGYGQINYQSEAAPVPAPAEAFYIPQDQQVEIDLVQECLHYPELIRGVGPTGKPYRDYGIVLFDMKKTPPAPKAGSLGVGTNVTGWDQVKGGDRYATRLLFLSRIDMR